MYTRKRVTLWTNAPWLVALGIKMDPERAGRLRALQAEQKIRIVRRYTDCFDNAAYMTYKL